MKSPETPLFIALAAACHLVAKADDPFVKEMDKSFAEASELKENAAARQMKVEITSIEDELFSHSCRRLQVPVAQSLNATRWTRQRGRAPTREEPVQVPCCYGKFCGFGIRPGFAPW